MITLDPTSDYLFYTDVSGNQYYCVPGSATGDVSGTIVIPTSTVPIQCIAVGGGGGCSIEVGNSVYCGGAGSGGFYYKDVLVPGSYGFTIGTGGRYDTSLVDGNPTILSSITAQGGQSTAGNPSGASGGGGGNGGGGSSFGINAYNGGGGGDIVGNIGVNANYGNPIYPIVNSGGGGAVIPWGGPSSTGQDATLEKSGNGGGGGGIGASGTLGGGGGGGYLGGNGSTKQAGSVPTGGRGYGGGGASAQPGGGLGGGGGGFDPRILYVYAHGVPSGFDWSSSSLNDMITGNGDSTAAFLSGTTAGGDPIIPNEATVIGNPGALFFVLYSSEPLPCFLKGTRILTPAGYTRVEDIQSGSHVVTSDKRVVKASVYTYTIDRATEETAPYKIPSGALGDYLPLRDLYISGNHAIKIRGYWQIPKYLAQRNPEIQQHSLGESVTYYHIECPNYLRDNLVAEGVIAESLNRKRKVVWEKNVSGYTRTSVKKEWWRASAL